MNKKDIQTREDIELLVATFYQKAISDSTIGYIFTDIAKINLETHLPRICNFWESIILGTNSFTGNPMVKHIELSNKEKLTKEHFERWLFLWKETVTDLFEGVKSEEMISRAQSIAAIMSIKVK